MAERVFAILTVGGVGSRMKTDIPKQYLSIFDRPVISYTMEAFERAETVDGILVVCAEGWENFIDAVAKQYRITKFIGTCLGGDTGQESIYNGLCFLKERIDENDIVLIHDGIRPLVPQTVINDCVETIRKHGNAVPVTPCNEVILKNADGKKDVSNLAIPRSILKKTQTPQGARLNMLLEMHERARREGKTYIATADLLIGSGFEVHYSTGSEKNIKLTTQEDLDIMKALLHVSGFSET